MSMMIHSEKKIGTVVKRSSKNLWVEIDQGCAGSASSCAVGCAGCSGKSRPGKAIISSGDSEKYKVGQKIEFLHTSLDANLVAFLVFGLPVSAALLTLLLWNVFSPASAETPLSFISAAVALLGGFSIVSAVDSWFRTKYPSKVLSILTSESTVNP